MKILGMYLEKSSFELLWTFDSFIKIGISIILVIAAKHKFEEHLSVPASVKRFLIWLDIFSFSKLLQQ